MSSTTSESVASTSGSNPSYSTSLPATPSESSSGTTRPPDPLTGNGQLRLADADIQRVAQAVTHIIGRSSTAQSQPNPITVGSSPARMSQSSEGEKIGLPEV